MRMLMAIVLVLVAGLAVAQEEGQPPAPPPIMQLLKPPRTLEKQVGFWFAIRSAIIGVGIDPAELVWEIPSISTGGSRQERRAKRLKLSRKYPEWHAICCTPEKWKPVVTALSGLMGTPLLCEGEAGKTHIEATWLFDGPWQDSPSFAITMTGGRTELLQ
jgi:hypothetical protein